jgi:MFS family permease
VLSQPVLRRVLPGMLVSALGDGMSLVAVAWLAVQIAPAGRAGVWTGLAVAAYALPATLGAVVLGRLVRGLSGTRLVAADSLVRAIALGTIASLSVAGALTPTLYVTLLALSSLLHAWGYAGMYTLIAEVLPADDRVVGNAVLTSFAQAATVVGPAIAGALATVVGAGWVIGADAASFGVLAVSCWLVTVPAASRTATSQADGPHRPARSPAAVAANGSPAATASTSVATAPADMTSAPAGEALAAAQMDGRPASAGDAHSGARDPEATNGPTAPGHPIAADGSMSGWRAITGQPQLLALVVVTCVFFFLYGPVEVGLPVHVAKELTGSPGLLGAFWSVFGVGAVIGGLGAGLLRDRPLWTVVAGIIVGWGVALLPLGLSDAVAPALVGFAIGGLSYGPFIAVCTELFQRTTPAPILSRVLATRTALTTPSVAIGTLLAGPMVGAIGGRRTLLVSAVLTIMLGLLVAAVVGLGRTRTAKQRPGPTATGRRPAPATPSE